MSYREQFYDQYVTYQVKSRGKSFSEQDYVKWASGVKKHIVDWLPNDMEIPILDVGCGPGNLIFLFQQLGYRNLTGIDLSPEQIDLARNQFPQATIYQGDVRDFLKDHAESYGLICAFDVIEHFQKDEIIPFLELIYESLQPGGRLILQTPNAESPWFGSVAYGDFTHEWFFTPDGLKSILHLVKFGSFQARESGLHIHGAKSLIRFGLWQLIRIGLAAWNLAETGGTGSGIYNRVFLATAVKNKKD